MSNIDELFVGIQDDDCIEKLHSIVDILKINTLNNDRRFYLKEDHFSSLLPLINSKDIIKSTYIFRIIRNACANDKSNALLVLRSALINPLMDILKEVTFSHKNSKDELNFIKCGLQSFGNLASCNYKDLNITIFQGLGINFLRTTMSFVDKSICRLASFLNYNLFLEAEITIIIDDPSLVDLLETSLHDIGFNEHPSEWNLLWIQSLLTKPHFIQRVFNLIQYEKQLILVDIIQEMVTNHDQKGYNLNNTNMIDLSTVLNNWLKSINSNKLTNEINNGEFPLLFKKILNMFGDYTSNEKRDKLPEENEIFDEIVNTLKSIHLLNKSKRDLSNTQFKLSSQKTSLDDLIKDAEEDGLFDVKKKFVRIIANLSYNNGKIKSIARTNDCIPLICDMFHFDNKNPFIREWAILALRNLLEDDAENQSIVSGMVHQGVIANNELLKQLGLRIVGEKIVSKYRP